MGGLRYCAPKASRQNEATRATARMRAGKRRFARRLPYDPLPRPEAQAMWHAPKAAAAMLLAQQGRTVKSEIGQLAAITNAAVRVGRRS
jgi:hypothetical protein